MLLTEVKLKDRKGYAIIEAISPIDGKVWDLRMSLKKIEDTKRKGSGQTKELAFNVPHAIQSPTAIFEGIREEGEKDWLCYSGKPEKAYHYHIDAELSPWPEKVFLVFVNSDRTIINWYWDFWDDQDKDLPRSHKTRFTKRVL